jgi:hypothetical protein
MTYDVSKLPAVRAQLERDLAARAQPKPEPTSAAPEFVRAPQAGEGGRAVVR